MIETVIFPVAGLGTRFLPATKAVPKEMLPVLDRPLIQWAVEEAAAAGCKHFVFVIAAEKRAIIEHFSDAPQLAAQLRDKGKHHELELLRAGLPDGARITQIIQDKPRGLGHAIWCARKAIAQDAFAVILPDDLVLNESLGCLTQMCAAYRKTGGNLIAVEEVAATDTDRYGIVESDSENGGLVRVRGLVEKPSPQDAPSRLAIIGRYILERGIMDALAKGEKGAGGEIQLTDALAQSLATTPTHGVRFSGTRYDCGSREGFIAANIAYARAAGILP